MNCKIQTGINNVVLRTKSNDISTISDDILELAERLFKCMIKEDGVGLAAPQIGINKRMISITQRKIKGKKYKFEKDLILINPQIIHFSEKKEVDEEGCLSVPGITGDVERSKSIVVRYMDLNGNNLELSSAGLNARIVQHEIDHLDGILFVDKILKQKPIDLNNFLNVGL